jgi:hypothetical protein
VRNTGSLSIGVIVDCLEIPYAFGYGMTMA